MKNILRGFTHTNRAAAPKTALKLVFLVKLAVEAIIEKNITT